MRDNPPQITTIRHACGTMASGDRGHGTVFHLTFLVSLSTIGCLMGYSFGFSSPASADLISDNGGPRGVLSNDAVAWFGSLIYVGTVFGGPIGGVCGDKFGRKSTVLLPSFPCALGYLFVVFPSSLTEQDEQHIIYPFASDVHCLVSVWARIL